VDAPVLFLAAGTRGDVQPFVALARGLSGRGTAAVVAAPARFRELVEQHGVRYVQLDGNPSDLMDRGPDGMAASLDSGVARGAAATLQFLREAKPEYERMLASAAAAAVDVRARAVVTGLPTLWGSSIAEALAIPFITCMLQPWGRTAAFPSPLLPVRGSAGRLCNAMSYRLVEQATWQPWRRTVNAWRGRALGLPPLSLRGPWPSLYARGFDCLYGFSAAVVPPPSDWPPRHRVTGYWFLDDEHWHPDPRLERFLADGEPPLYVGFGSLGMRPGTLEMVDAALERTGLRAVVTGGTHDPPSRRIFPCGEVPHGWLFPRVRAVVHHGGAGTTAEGLRAGVPSFVVPGAADQYFWGGRISALGAGPPPAARARLTVGSLAAAFLALARDHAMRAAAARVGETVRAEDGVACAAACIGEILRGDAQRAALP
jgi:sterol 3beta-glucosyltransferase